MYNTSTVRVRTKITPLSEDADKVKLWLETQPDPASLFKRFSYDEMKAALMTHLNPEEEIKETADSVESKEHESDLPWDKPVQKYTLNTKKSDIDSKIDDLFSDF